MISESLKLTDISGNELISGYLLKNKNGRVIGWYNCVWKEGLEDNNDL